MGAIYKLRLHGLPYAVASVLQRISPRPIGNAGFYLEQLKGLRCLEIGGPSPIFGDRGPLPLYRVIASLDNVNLRGPSGAFRYHASRPTGMSYVAEAAPLSFGDGAYDCVLSSHVIEHCANPLGALREWMRVVRKGGLVLTVAPERSECFDHSRAATPWQHLLEDERRSMPEGDETHVEEFIAHMDRRLLSKPDAAILESRARENLVSRWVHHHTWSAAMLVKAMMHVGLDILAIDKAPISIVALGRKE